LTLTMAWALFLLTLLSYWSGATSQTTLTQPPSQSVALGQMVKLSCTASSNKQAICWVQQKSGQSPRYIQCAGYSRGDGVPERFTATDSGNVGSLTITNTQPEDEADYYCYMWPSRGSGCHNGANTLLPVTLRSTYTIHLRNHQEQSVKPLEKGEYKMKLQRVSSLPSLVQHPLETVSLDQTAKLSCTVSGTQYTISWYHQRSGQTPRYVHYAGGSKGEGIPDRFTASVSGNVGYLTILNIQAEDEGDYYCGMWYDSSNWKYHRGEV
ncbi:UNVERIFIED_CONTAM: hypothetical protein K2H54_021790, partial [Gekko kuhli]